jgi:hypothetical protein
MLRAAFRRWASMKTWAVCGPVVSWRFSRAGSLLRGLRRAWLLCGAKTKPQLLSQLGFRNLILTMTYSHMGKPHTTIGDASFHC